ncbi:MAG TPA: PfkB family carbohydrate kinase [Terracidiphilus sp.]|nr:PfkB family carbohydrate kinase [Terracidiphilus sp.]
MARGVFVGLSTIDIVYAVDKFPAPNSKITARSQDVFVGGPATNAAIAFAHLEGGATLATAVGRHSLGETIRRELENHFVQFIDLTPGFEEMPAISSVTVDKAGRRNVVSANAIRMAAPSVEIHAKALEQARIVLVDGHSMPACQAWAAAARARKIPVVFDGGSWKDGTADLLMNVDAVICSADFAPPGCANEDETLRYLKDAGVREIAITHGGDPVRFEAGQSSGTLRVPPVEAVDTMGAGDILHGAYCYFASMGRGFIEALAEAAEIASQSCCYPGTRAWMKHVARATPA